MSGNGRAISGYDDWLAFAYGLVLAMSDGGLWEDRMRIWRILIVSLSLLATLAVLRAQEVGDADPQALIDAAVDQLQAADSFKLTITQTGEPYPLALSFDGVNMLPATLQTAETQYLSPDELHISAELQLFLPLSLSIYSHGDQQWLSFPSGAPWYPLPAFEGFDVNRLLAPGDGIEFAMANLSELSIEAVAAQDREPAIWQLRARASGTGVSVLLFGFIEPQADVEVVATITAEDGRFASLDIIMLETLDATDSKPSLWHLQFHDYDGPRDFEPPSL